MTLLKQIITIFVFVFMVCSYQFHDFFYKDLLFYLLAIIPGIIFGFLLSWEKKYIFSKKILFTVACGLLYFGVILLGFRIANFFLGLSIPTILGTLLMTTIYWLFENRNFSIERGLIFSIGFAIILSGYTLFYEHLRPKQYYDLSVWAFLPIFTTILLWQLFYPSIVKKFYEVNDSNSL